MASIKMGAIITDIRGKVGGTVFKGSRSGLTATNIQLQSPTAKFLVRNKNMATMKNRPTNALSAASTRWKSLTDEQRASWTAAAPDFPFINKYGQPYVGSGFQLYVSITNRLATIGADIPTVAPPPTTLEIAPAFTIAPSVPPGTMFVADFDFPDDFTATMYATGPMSPARQPSVGSWAQIFSSDTPAEFMTELDQAWINHYGAIPLHATIWWKLVIVSQIVGYNGGDYIFKYTY